MRFFALCTPVERYFLWNCVKFFPLPYTKINFFPPQFFDQNTISHKEANLFAHLCEWAEERRRRGVSAMQTLASPPFVLLLQQRSTQCPASSPPPPKVGPIVFPPSTQILTGKERKWTFSLFFSPVCKAKWWSALSRKYFLCVRGIFFFLSEVQIFFVRKE